MRPSFKTPCFSSTPRGILLGLKAYRFSFNGKENDNEVEGHQDYGMRVYDMRLAMFKSVDPLAKEYPYYSTYQFSGNSPIQYIDLDGAEPAKPKGDGFIQESRDGAFAGRNMNENPVQITMNKNQLKIGVVKPYEPNVFETFKEKVLTIKSTDGVITKSSKVAGNILYGTANNTVIYGSNLLGFDPVNLEGHTVSRGNELTEAGMDVIMNFVPAERIVGTLGSKSLNYSEYVGSKIENLLQEKLSVEVKRARYQKDNFIYDNFENLKKKGIPTMETVKDGADASKDVDKGKENK
jgi:RHS repeat-associated protein